MIVTMIARDLALLTMPPTLHGNYQSSNAFAPAHVQIYSIRNLDLTTLPVASDSFEPRHFPVA